MAVNNMTKEQAYSLIASIHNQATGNNVIAPTSTADFISVAQATLQAGYEQTLNAITQVIQRTIIAVRPYDAKFTGLEMTADQWGGIIRKLNYADRGPESDSVHYTVDGVAVDQFVVRKPVVLETRYVGSDVYQGSYTIYREQLKTAFDNEGNFGSFMTGLMTHFLNERTQWLEDMKRGLLMNAIGSVYAINNTESVVHLLSEYNTVTGASPAFTAQTIMQPANFKPFMEWCYSRVSEVSRLFTERSELFQQKITGVPIYRHTPYADQRVYMNAKFLEQMDSMVLADTYHDNFLRYADVEPVSFWQAITSPMSVQVTPVYIDGTGAVVNGTAQTLSNVVGIIFDRDALGYNIYNDSLDASPYNAKGLYYNLFAHMDIQMQQDVTEKMAIFLLD